MTVQYYQEVLSAGPIAFLKLLRKWKGGVFKLIYVDFIIFSVLYAFISCLYRFILNEDHRRQFEKVVTYVYKSQSLIPVAFILGFYVNLVFGRFWRHFNTVPWVTKIAVMLASHLVPATSDPSLDDKGLETEKEEARMQRRSIIRYLTSALIITLSRVSVPVKRRFPTLDDLATKGVLLEHEVDAIKAVEPITMQPFIPVTWSTSIVMQANGQKRIINEAVLINLVKEINKFRHNLQELFLLDQVCVPLVYTQVVTLAVYSYFLSCLIGRQFINPPSSDISKSTTKDFIVPIFTVLQFIVYVGWLKLALTLVNPMGEDDEDFDLNCIVDYNFEVGLAIVDGINENIPALEKDKFFDKKMFDLPMENSMKNSKAKPFMGSVYDMKLDSDNWFTSLRSIVTNESAAEDDAQDFMSLVNLNKIDSIKENSKESQDSLSRSGSVRSQHQRAVKRTAHIPTLKEEEVEEPVPENKDQTVTEVVVHKFSDSFSKDKEHLRAIKEEESDTVESTASTSNKTADQEHICTNGSNETIKLLDDDDANKGTS